MSVVPVLTRRHATPRPVQALGKRATVPPPSPAWYGSVMGSAILATLTELRSDVVPFAHVLAVSFWGLSVALLVTLSVTFAARIKRSPAAFTASVATPVAMAQWGMVSMGILAVGSATSAVLPDVGGALRGPAWKADLVLWVVGTLLGLTTAFAVPWRLRTDDPGTPTTVWGLAVVPPMVSATVGAGLAGWVESPAAKVGILLVSVVCFLVALVLGTVLFTRAYRHHWFVEPLPLDASISAWLPLGIVGQSTAAAQGITGQSASLLAPRFGRTVEDIAHVYGFGMLALGVPLLPWALAMTVRGFARGMAFSPGWWGMTFPVGTLVLGSTMLGRSTGQTALSVVGGALLGLLFATWSICAVASGLAVLRRRP